MHHRPAALGRHDQGFYRSLPLLEILLGLGKLLDIVRGVLEGYDLATILGCNPESTPLITELWPIPRLK